MLFRHILVLALTAVLSSTSLTAQAIQGTVTNSAGDPVFGALVTFIDKYDQYNTFSGITDGTGHYQITLPTVSVQKETPAPFALRQNFPNPFNPSTTIPFTLDTAGQVRLTVYNVMGQRVATLLDDYCSPGAHTVNWHGLDDNGNNVSAGLYLYKLTFDNRHETRKMLLIDGGEGISSVSGSHGTSNSDGQVAFKKASGTTYNVKIEHESIVPFKKRGVMVSDSQTMDFVVIGMTFYKGFTFATIPGGTFQMGDVRNDGESDEKPVHTVTVSTFEMSIYEVTNAQYAKFLNEALATGYITVSGSSVTGKMGDWCNQRYCYVSDSSNSYPGNECIIVYSSGSFSVKSGFENWPATWVTWYGSKALAEYYGLDLAREAEWEYACRGGNQYTYGTANGTISTDTVNYKKKIGHPTDVDSYPANNYGLCDMSGNVQEWCNDWYGTYSSDSLIDPSGAQKASYRVYRGGRWSSPEYFCRSACRFYVNPDFSYHNLGFRVVRR